MKIGIGITTRNRRDVLLQTLQFIKKYQPENSKLIIVDDASDEPFSESTYRFEKNVGIATSKNKCFELLEDCEHIFLFDDDCYPIHKDWYLPYVNSPHKHLMYIFKDFTIKTLNDTEILYKDDSVTAYSHPRGCMLYYKKEILEKVGGMDIEYGKWGHEHGDLSNRIYNAGLTLFRYMDITDSNRFIYSCDENKTVKSTTGKKERVEYLALMDKKYKNSLTSKEYKPYKNYVNIITSYFINIKDPQRDAGWKADLNLLKPLIDSVDNLIILNDCFDEKDTEKVKFIKVSTGTNPYFQRWISYWQFLLENPQLEQVFFVDATDVIKLNNPKLKKDKIYIGSENEIIGCKWVINTTKGETLKKFVSSNRNILLNAGLVGGYRETIMPFIRDIIRNYTNVNNKEITDMPIINYIAYTKYKDKIEYGNHINTEFKKYEITNAWFKHK